MIRALIVDDEEPARERLRRLLAVEGEVEVAGEASDGEGAMTQIAALAPDLVFLDIEMPGATGLEVAASLPSPRPHIIFCTAYDQYAVDAFELNAADYLLKPVSRARLAKALERVRHGQRNDAALDRSVRALPPVRFLARRGNSYRVVHAREVLYFASEDGLTRLETAAGHSWVPPALNDLEERLNPRQFFRVSRSAIVNLDAIVEVVPLPGGQGQVVLRNGARLDVSRRRLKELTEKLGG